MPDILTTPSIVVKQEHFGIQRSSTVHFDTKHNDTDTNNTQHINEEHFDIQHDNTHTNYTQHRNSEHIDTQHNYIQYNNTKFNNSIKLCQVSFCSVVAVKSWVLLIVMQSVIVLTVIMLSVVVLTVVVLTVMAPFKTEMDIFDIFFFLLIIDICVSLNRKLLILKYSKNKKIKISIFFLLNPSILVLSTK